jgi:HlyD family secretion protein
LTTTTTRKGTAARIAGLLALLGVLAFIGWGLWLAYHPVPVPLQGQVEARTFNIAPKISARIATLPIREGQAVAAGAVLATLDSPELRAKVAQAGAAQAAANAKRDLVDVGARAEDVRVAKAMWDKATASAELAETTYRRLNALYKEGLVAANDEGASQLIGSRPAQTTLRSASRGRRQAAPPGCGGVAEVEASAQELVLKAPQAAESTRSSCTGRLVTAGFGPHADDLSDIWVVFNVREDDFSGIRLGAPLDGNVPALANRQIRFVIDTISPRGDYATWRATRQSSGYDVRTFEVRARPQAPVEGLRPGMSVLVDTR